MLSRSHCGILVIRSGGGNNQQTTIMNQNTKRSILRWIHILFGLPLAGYIYGPPSETLQYLPFFRYIYLPIVLLSGGSHVEGPRPPAAFLEENRLIHPHSI